ncbi:unnamed protein product [Dracunculus medinensis]|uniref:WPP domain-containing protein n=1 Tax=Dracunculus medinensis TaxID=318479 RepID=A0A0N4UMA3_DRAME|nr:unnamed protein product [Dracunculus medinensis]
MWLEKKGEGGKGEEGRCVTSGTWGSEEITAVAECNGIRRIKGLQIEDNALGSDAREGAKTARSLAKKCFKRVAVSDSNGGRVLRSLEEVLRSVNVLFS